MANSASVRVDPGITYQVMSSLEKSLRPSGLGVFLTAITVPYLHERAEDRFRRGGDDRSGRWKELAPYTQAQRAAKGYGAKAPINKRSGELHDFITGHAGSLEVDPTGASVRLPGSGSEDEEKKLKVAQAGLSPNPIPGFADVPARPVIGLNERDAFDISRRFGRWLEEEISGFMG